MAFNMATFTLIHVIISMIGILAGLVVVGGLMAGVRYNGWIATYLATTILTNATGFGFPFVVLMPSHILGVISLVILPFAVVALYLKHSLQPRRNHPLRSRSSSSLPCLSSWEGLP